MERQPQATGNTIMTSQAAAVATSRLVLTLSDLKWAVGGWFFFIAENAVLSENRTAIIDYLGSDETYHAVYGTCSTIATATILYSYRKLKQQKHALAIVPLSGARLGFAGSVMSLGLVLASQSVPKVQIPVEFARETVSTDSSNVQAPSKSWNLKVRCPFDFTDKKKDGDSFVNVTGLDRVSRHPGLWALGLATAGNAALQPTAALAVWMLGPALTAWLGGSHTDSRYRRGLGGTVNVDYDRQTSNIPFAAMLTGQQEANSMQIWITEEIKPLNAVIAVGVACVWVASRGRAIRAGASLFTRNAVPA